ncbi:MAG TPA: hypothetical protein VFP72_22130 [Kineosporiaceae bacterium]|nr:hypothetical protein [Kineosporiaceae bacterium]
MPAPGDEVTLRVLGPVGPVLTAGVVRLAWARTVLVELPDPPDGFGAGELLEVDVTRLVAVSN